MIDQASLPPRQKDVVELIVKLTQEQGYPPTLAELAKSMGLRNRMTVHQHVAALKKKGLVHWEPGLNRSLRVIGPVSTLTSSASSSVVSMDRFRDTGAGSRHAGLPLAGRIAAGQPIDAVEQEEYLEIDGEYAKSGCFALKVKGDSMIEEGIFDGDYVIVKPNPSPTNGEIAVALMEDGTATLKRFYKEGGRYRLQPANSKMDPIYVSPDQDIQIQGTLVGLFRKF